MSGGTTDKRNRGGLSNERDGARPSTGHWGIAPTVGIVLLCLTMVLVVVGTVLLFGGGDLGRVVWGLPGGTGLWALGFSGAGYPITRRHPENPVGWCLMVAGVAAGVNLVGSGITGVAALGDLPLWLVNTWVVAVGALCTAVVFFPSGSPPSRWWWAQLGVLWGSGCLEYFMAYERGAGFIGLPEWLDVLATPADIVFQFSLATGFLSLLVRWRRSGAVERQQLKWVVYTVALLATTALVVEVGISRHSSPPCTSLAPSTLYCHPRRPAGDWGGHVALPALRHRPGHKPHPRLRLPHRHARAALLRWRSGLEYVFRAFTGQGSSLAIVATTLAIAVLFNPLRRRLQVTIDRRFYRKRYDAVRTLEGFSGKLRDETDLETLHADLVYVIQETLQPAHVTLWLAPGKEGDD